MKSETTIYTCPMHSEVHQDKPGSCPKCGMKLVPTEMAKLMEEDIRNKF